MAYLVSTTVTLFLFWLTMSGFFEAWLLASGMISTVLVIAVSMRMGIIDIEGHPIRLGVRAVVYWPWLVWEIVKAAWGVSRIILDPKLPISPKLVRAKTSQKTVVGRVTYANSITLTPGTISIEVADEDILVHALTKAGADDLLAGEMDRRVTRFEGAK